jgi:hypothetical protein
MGKWMYRSTFSWPQHYLEASGQLHAPALYPPRKESPVPIGFGGTQFRSGRLGEEKILDPNGTRTPTPQSSSPCLAAATFPKSFIHSFIHQWLSTPLLGPGLFLSFVIFLHGRTPWTSNQPVARTLPTHRTTQTQNKHINRHPCIEWDSNPRPQLSSERRQFMP